MRWLFKVTDKFSRDLIFKKEKKEKKKMLQVRVRGIQKIYV